MKDEDIENNLECENTNDIEVREKKSSRAKIKEIISNRRNKILWKNIPIDQQILAHDKEEMEIKREMLKKMELKISSLAVLWKHFKKTCPTSRISFHSQYKWLHHLTLTLNQAPYHQQTGSNSQSFAYVGKVNHYQDLCYQHNQSVNSPSSSGNNCENIIENGEKQYTDLS